VFSWTDARFRLNGLRSVVCPIFPAPRDGRAAFPALAPDKINAVAAIMSARSFLIPVDIDLDYERCCVCVMASTRKAASGVKPATFRPQDQREDDPVTGSATFCSGYLPPKSPHMSVQPFLQKYFSGAVGQLRITRFVSCPDQRGVSRSSQRGAGCGGREVVA
jgi:hypothetical protein